MLVRVQLLNQHLPSHLILEQLLIEITSTNSVIKSTFTTSKQDLMRCTS